MPADRTYSDHYGDDGLAERAARILAGKGDGSPAGDLSAALDEIERLARILAVEQGDESQAPEGWAYNFEIESDGWPLIEWRRPGSQVWRGPTAPSSPLAWVWWWSTRDCLVGTRASSALEAMEAADAAGVTHAR